MLITPDDMIGKPIGFTCSTFDLLHAGHILMLSEAKSLCDYLIVGLQTDPTIDRPEIKNKPVQSVVERYVQLSAVKFVDQIVVLEVNSRYNKVSQNIIIYFWTLYVQIQV